MPLCATSGMAHKSADPVAELRKFVAKHPSRAAAARALGVTRQYLNGVLRGDHGPSDAVLAKMGLERVVIRRTA